MLLFASTVQPRDCITLKQTGSVPAMVCNSSSSDIRRSLCLKAQGGCVSGVMRSFRRCCRGMAALGQHGAPVWETVGGSGGLQRAEDPHCLLQPITTILCQIMLDSQSVAAVDQGLTSLTANSPDHFQHTTATIAGR